MSKIVCPNCGIISTDKDFDNGEEHFEVWINEYNKSVCKCWECEYEFII